MNNPRQISTCNGGQIRWNHLLINWFIFFFYEVHKIFIEFTTPGCIKLMSVIQVYSLVGSTTSASLAQNADFCSHLFLWRGNYFRNPSKASQHKHNNLVFLWSSSLTIHLIYYFLIKKTVTVGINWINYGSLLASLSLSLSLCVPWSQLTAHVGKTSNHSFGLHNTHPPAEPQTALARSSPDTAEHPQRFPHPWPAFPLPGGPYRAGLRTTWGTVRLTWREVASQITCLWYILCACEDMKKS